MKETLFNYGIILVSFLITSLAQIYVKINYSRYSSVKPKKNIIGSDVARKILNKHDLKDMDIESIPGNLTDHYDSRSKVLRLSEENFQNSSIASLSVAAHEVGHAIQDKEGYFFLRARHAIFPLVKISSYLGYLAIAIGLSSSMLKLFWIGIYLECAIVLFQVITLPVEFDASKRALKELKNTYLTEEELRQAKTMLTSAALTYVSGAVSSFLNIIRLIGLANRNRND